MKLVSLSITLLLLAGYWVQTRDYPSAASATPFHAQIARQIEQIPTMIGPWRLVDRPSVPPSAYELLRPNALSGMHLRNDETGENITFVIVQCRDSRDMAGHYPPNCYPSHGWRFTREELAPPVMHTIAGVPIVTQLYEFMQPSFPRERRMKVVSSFAIPGKGYVSDIKSVRRAAEDYRVRPYGAAQFQLVLDGSFSDERAHAIFDELGGHLAPLLQALSSDPLTSPQSLPSPSNSTDHQTRAQQP